MASRSPPQRPYGVPSGAQSVSHNAKGGAQDSGGSARVLIVDDSVVARAVIAQLIDASDRFSVVGAVGTAKAALEFLARATVEFILLDIEMPGVDGLTALPALIAAGKGARVLIVSSSADDGAAKTVQALALGAAETMAKPEPGALSLRFGAALVAKLERLSEIPGGLPPAVLVRDPARGGRLAESARQPLRAIGSATSTALGLAAARDPDVGQARVDDYDIVAIGASTGGIHALSQLFRELPTGFRLPIVITQHLPTSFMPYFAAQIALLAGRPCDVATDRLRIRPGRIVIAPGDAHLRCVALGDGGAAFRLTHEPAASGCMPSVDPMLASIAEVYGARTLAIVLSGMGRDGADGARRVHDAGGCVIAQDQASSVVWGMPGAVAASGIADALLPPDAIGRLVASRRRP